MISSFTTFLTNLLPRSARAAVWACCLLLAACGTSQSLPAPSPTPAPAAAEPAPAPAAVEPEAEAVVAEPAPRPRGAPQIEEVYGTRRLNPGEAETFRARMKAGATLPVQYVWDFGDGVYSVGSTVTHRFAEPGTYRVQVVARNRVSADTSTVEVTVGSASATAPAPAAPPAPVEEGLARLAPRSGEVVWIVGRYTPGEDRALERLRHSGFPVGLVRGEEGEHWLGVGPYSPAGAETIRPRLEPLSENPLWLYSPDRL